MLYQKLKKKEKKEPQRNSVAKEYNEIKKKNFNREHQLQSGSNTGKNLRVRKQEFVRRIEKKKKQEF